MKKFEKKIVNKDQSYFSDDQGKPQSTSKDYVIKLPSNKIRGKNGTSVPPIKVLNSNESVMNMENKSIIEKKQPVEFTIKKQIKKNSTASYFALSSDMNNITNRTSKMRQSGAQGRKSQDFDETTAATSH